MWAGGGVGFGIGLPTETVDDFGAGQVLLFGGLACGEAGPGSDVDLLALRIPPGCQVLLKPVSECIELVVR
ncbi:hypothetical protein CKO31_24665 [Thiohalocapsa halophila]|uniref:Polymerase nucleotidyl transferase domain-containing protein n=1 Tax=Thiohalocapsa halophila TaxID=69359 RepID=A0ABS1CPQ4_9GAMM|nr:hypothetical protein [Thiohalocapsa halophila]